MRRTRAARALTTLVVAVAIVNFPITGRAAETATIEPPYDRSSGHSSWCSSPTGSQCATEDADAATGDVSLSVSSTGTSAATGYPCVTPYGVQWCAGPSSDARVYASPKVTSDFMIPEGIGRVVYTVTADVESATTTTGSSVELFGVASRERYSRQEGGRNLSSGGQAYEARTETFEIIDAHGGGGPAHVTVGLRASADPTGAGTASADAQARIVKIDIDMQPNRAPTASWEAECTDLTCEFTVTYVNDPEGDDVSVRWNFGDGEGANATRWESSVHTYESAGVYEVTLTATDWAGAMGTSTRQITVGDAEQTPSPTAEPSPSAEPSPTAEPTSAPSLEPSPTAEPSAEPSPSVQPSPSLQPSKPELAATITGRSVSLSWSGSEADSIDVLRGGRRIATVANDGDHVDTLRKKQRGRFKYAICDAGTTRCSNGVTVRR